MNQRVHVLNNDLDPKPMLLFQEQRTDLFVTEIAIILVKDFV